MKRLIFPLCFAFVALVMACMPQGTEASDTAIYDEEVPVSFGAAPLLAVTLSEEVVSADIPKAIKSDAEETDIFVEAETFMGLTEEEINLIALITMGEAEGECELGKRLVIDTILNRVDSCYFPNDVSSVVYQKNQFSPVWNGRLERCYVDDDIVRLVFEELERRTDYDVVFFRSGRYHSFGRPLYQIGGHYFSSYE